MKVWTMRRHLVAWVREVPATFGSAVTMAPKDRHIDVPLARTQWKAYTQRLMTLVDALRVIPADEDFPDCPFIEDSLVYHDGQAILTSPGHPSREGEISAIAESLQGPKTMYNGVVVKALRDVDPLAKLDGGDVLTTDSHMFVGVNGRTNMAGARALQKVFGKHIDVCPVDVSGIQGVLHLKSFATLLKPGVLCLPENAVGTELWRRMSESAGASFQYRHVFVPDPLSANVLTVQGGGRLRGVFMQGGRCAKSNQLIRNVYEPSDHLFELDMSEFIKADAGLTCLSVIMELPPS